jgi:hypothetical protein
MTEICCEVETAQFFDLRREMKAGRAAIIAMYPTALGIERAEHDYSVRTEGLSAV